MRRYTQSSMISVLFEECKLTVGLIFILIFFQLTQALASPVEEDITQRTALLFLAQTGAEEVSERFSMYRPYSPSDDLSEGSESTEQKRANTFCLAFGFERVADFRIQQASDEQVSHVISIEVKAGGNQTKKFSVVPVKEADLIDWWEKPTSIYPHDSEKVNPGFFVSLSCVGELDRVEEQRKKIEVELKGVEVFRFTETEDIYNLVHNMVLAGMIQPSHSSSSNMSSDLAEQDRNIIHEIADAPQKMRNLARKYLNQKFDKKRIN